METLQVSTMVDGQSFHWTVSGNFSWGEGGALFNAGQDVLFDVVGEDGYFVKPLPAGMAESALAAIRQFIEGYGVTVENYHGSVSDELHAQIISKSRQLTMETLGWDGEEIARHLSAIVGAELSSYIPDMGGNHVQVRINRPGSTDFNPPHRDGAVPCFRNTVNLWIPIFNCTAKTRLPVVPGSHLVAESECYQTPLANAQIGGKTYNVPAIVATRNGDWEMIRPAVEFGEALVFTPFLVHGVGVNQSDGVRIALELRLTVVSQHY